MQAQEVSGPGFGCTVSHDTTDQNEIDDREDGKSIRFMLTVGGRQFDYRMPRE